MSFSPHDSVSVRFGSFSFCHAEYGRTCKDIGCLPSETCIIASDSCSWSQQEGKECGTYPTCKKSSTVNNSPGKRNLNMVEHAKFDFLIVFVYCIFFGGPQIEQNISHDKLAHTLKPNHQTHTHAHTQTNLKKHKPFNIGLHIKSIQNEKKTNGIGKLHGLNKLIWYIQNNVIFSRMIKTNGIIESHRPHLSFLFYLWCRCQSESSPRQHSEQTTTEWL